MRVVLVNNFFYPRVGGSSTVVEQLAESLSSKGHSVLVVTGQYLGSETFESRNGYDIYRLPTWILPESKFTLNFDINFALKFGNYRKLTDAINNFNPDVIHCHGQFLDLTWKALKFARRNKVPSILTLHTRLVNPGIVLNSLLYLLDQIVVRLILKIWPPDRFIIIDKTFRSYAKSRYRVREDSMLFIPVGVDVSRFSKKRTQARDKEQSKVILSIGHVIPVRNRLAIVRALPRILEIYPNTKLRILGNVYQDGFMRLAKKLKVDHAIEAPGAVASAEIPNELSRAALEIHDIQGYGISIASLEAMASGVTCVMATDLDYFPHAPMIPGFHFIHVSSENSHEIADAVIQTFDNSENSNRIAKQGSEYVRKNFNIADIVNSHLLAYRALKD